MNFFQHQEDARRQSRRLVVFFLLAVVLIIASVNAAVGIVALLVSGEPVSVEAWLAKPWWMTVSLLTLLVIVVGSIFRMHQLRQGGDAIAEWSGAKRLDMHSRDYRERAYINVAEEMAIASGMPLPSLWVMEREAGINAFVAGLQPTEAALVVTRGALEQLDRDELQGVIGHEFSHIFHGDMRLNVRLMGLLAGILAIGQVGGLMLRSTGAGISHRSNAQARGVMFGAGAALMAIGYVGLFFGRLIKASVSRQREYLADASAVQYTRNSDGIASALAKIGGFSFGSNLVGARAEEMSHMCFGETLRMNFGGLLATHPPLKSRIERIDPHFGIKQRSREKRAEPQPDASFERGSQMAEAMGFAAMSQDVISVNAAAVVETVGNPSASHVEYAHALHQAMPDMLSVAVHGLAGARAAVMATLLGDSEELRAARTKIISSAIDDKAAAEVADIYASAETQWPRLRLAVVDLALPQLKSMPTAERKRFIKLIGELIAADRRMSLFEFTLLAVLRRHLPYSEKRNKRPTSFSFQKVEREIALMLSLVIRVGGDSADADARYARLLRTFVRSEIPRDSLPRLDAKSLTTALDKLQTLVPILKSTLIEALVECTLHNGHITIKEAELLRAISETLDCPLPPLIDTNNNQ